MKTVLGVLLMVAGVVVGLYVGVYLMFIGGIIQFIDGVKADPVNSSDIAWGALRFIGAWITGWVSFLILFIPGLAMVADD